MSARNRDYDKEYQKILDNMPKKKNFSIKYRSALNRVSKTIGVSPKEIERRNLINEDVIEEIMDKHNANCILMKKGKKCKISAYDAIKEHIDVYGLDFE